MSAHPRGRSDRNTGDRSLLLLCAGSDRSLRQWFSQQRVAGPTAILHSLERGEAKAFARFPSPDALAVSLSAGGTEQRDAEAAMRAIQHVRSSYWDWFRDPDYFKSRADHILWIGRQESSRPEAARRGARPGELGTADRLPASEQEPTGRSQSLSDLARQNLRRWYAKDYLFLDLCDQIHPSRERFSGFGWPATRSNPRRSSDEQATVCSSECRRLPIGPSCTKQSQRSSQVSWSCRIAATHLTHPWAGALPCHSSRVVLRSGSRPGATLRAWAVERLVELGQVVS